MSQYYKGKRTRNMYDPKSSEPFRLSRSRIDLFMDCPRCFYLDRRLGVDRPPGFPFTLNSAVDALLKKEFDTYRSKQTAHPLMIANGINAVPFQHEKMNEWRDALRGGITYLHKPTNLMITGGIDDAWVDPKGELFIVDYKATAKNGEVNLDADWQIGYKRQMEIYQWLFRQNGFKVSPIGYFVYCNGITGNAVFNNRLDFDIKVIPYEGKDGWIEDVIFKIHKCLAGSVIPEGSADCDYCRYIEAVAGCK